MREPWIQTHCGIAFPLLNPKPEHIVLEDIAHALSQISRFNGHLVRPYTVAEHSINVASILPPEHRLWGLLHDAAEAYIGDITRPLKAAIPALEEVELRVLRVVARKYGLSWPMPQIVKRADDALIRLEAEELFDDRLHAAWSDGLPTVDDFPLLRLVDVTTQPTGESVKYAFLSIVSHALINTEGRQHEDR